MNQSLHLYSWNKEKVLGSIRGQLGEESLHACNRAWDKDREGYQCAQRVVSGNINRGQEEYSQEKEAP